MTDLTSENTVYTKDEIEFIKKFAEEYGLSMKQVVSTLSAGVCSNFEAVRNMTQFNVAEFNKLYNNQNAKKLKNSFPHYRTGQRW